MSLFDEVRSVKALTKAWRAVRKKNAKGGIDGITPHDLDKTFSKIIQRLSQNLTQGQYVPAPYEQLEIPKFNDANEWRSLSLPSVEDKIVQQAVVNVLSPIFEKQFQDCSYAYRRKKGAARALRRLEHIITTRKINWIVTQDIDNFFDTMNHELLLEKISQTIHEPAIISLIQLWMKTGFISHVGKFKEAGAGIAQGGIISPLLSNIYLDPMDRFAKSNHYDYIRYSDNFIGLFQERHEAESYSRKINEFIKTRLLLKLNKNETPVQSLEEGFVFLGLFFKRKDRKISTKKERQTIKKINWLTDPNKVMNLENTIGKINETVGSQKRYYAHINPARQFAVLDAHLIDRMKNLLICHAQKGNIKNRKKYIELLMKLERYNTEKTDKETKTAYIKMVDEIICQIRLNTKKIKNETPRLNKLNAANKRKMNTRTNKFLRQVANVSEVVVTSPGVFIGKTGKRIILRQNRKNICEHPIAKIRQITVAAKGVSFSSDVIQACAESSVCIIFTNHFGKPVAMIQNPETMMGKFSLQQLRIVESENALILASRILNGKCRNQMNLIKFYSRHRSKTDPVFYKQVRKYLDEMKNGLQEFRKMRFNATFNQSREKLFLIEARISGYYWNLIKNLLPPELGFVRREKQRAKDVVNNMLNYGYGMLYQRIWHAVVMANLNPNISFLHAIQNKKPALIYDLIEEFRQPLVDRPIFSMMTKGRRFEKFKLDPQTRLLDKNTKELTLKAVLARFAGLIGYRGRKVRGEDIIFLQADNLAKYISGRRKTYKPFISTY